MAGKEIDLGPTGRQVMENIARVRKALGLSYAELSRRLADAGRPIPPLGLRRIEEGMRRVDVDDLFALAAVLWVTPVILMLPPTKASEETVAATGIGETSAFWLWHWATWSGDKSEDAVLWRMPEALGERLHYDHDQGPYFAEAQAPRRDVEDLRLLIASERYAAQDVYGERAMIRALEAAGASEETLAEARERAKEGENRWRHFAQRLSEEAKRLDVVPVVRYAIEPPDDAP